MKTSTVGQLMIDEALPDDMKGRSPTLDGQGVKVLLRELAEKHPEEYRAVSHKLSRIGLRVAYTTGGNSFGLRHMLRPAELQKKKAQMQRSINRILDSDKLDDDKRDQLLLRLLGDFAPQQQQQIFESAKAAGNPLANQVVSGSRGNPLNLASIMGGDLLYADHRGRPLPVPVLNSYGEGLTPVEYWAGAYGARKGVIDLKFCLAAGTNVLMADYSSCPIEKVRAGNWVMGADRQGRLLPTRVRKVFENGKRVCYQYYFRKGSCRGDLAIKSLVATEDHEILAQVKAGRPGSTYAYRSVYTPTLLRLGSARLQRKSAKNEFVAYPARGEWDCEDRVPEPRALLAGLMLGDGCMAPSTHGSYTLSCADPILLLDIADYLADFNLEFRKASKQSSQYGYNLAEIKASQRVTCVIQGRNSFSPGSLNPTKAWLKYTLGDKLAYEKTMPEEVWNWDDQAVGELLAGLFATDGNVYQRKDGCSIKLSMTAYDIVFQTQRLLELRLGIWTSVLRRKPKETIPLAKHDQFEFVISHPESVQRFYDRVPIVGEKREQLIQAMAYRTRDPASKEVGFKILGKELVGPCETFDLEVANSDHLFCLANGLIVANSTQNAGYLAKQLNQLGHRLVVSSLDSDKESTAVRGLPVAVDDDESEGSLLAADIGGYKRNTVITPKILTSLRKKGIERMLVRSPTVGGPADGGVYGRDVGVREDGRIAWLGENPGMTAAQALSNPLTQAQISSKHSGGVVGAASASAISGFDWINQLIQTPKHFKGGAAHAEVDGLVQRIEDAPAGGKYAWIENKKHYIGKGFEPKIARGQHVEAGDIISEGLPNPSAVVRYKGIGEGRRYFLQAFRQAFRDAGIKGHRRNIEMLARGLINHVRLTEEMGDYVPDDIVPYQALEASYKPRPGYVSASPKRAMGKYLERPYLHYTVGTKVRPSMLKDFTDFGVTEVDVHDDEPPFQPEMIRGMANLQHDPDWLSRLFGTGQKKSLLSAVHRGGTSDATGTSFVPGLARGVDFGRIGKVHSPRPHPGLPKAAANRWEQMVIDHQANKHRTSQLSPEAARQLMIGHYQARRRAATQNRINQSVDRQVGPNSLVGKILGPVSNATTTGAAFTPLWSLGFAHKSRPAPATDGYVDPVEYDTPSGSFLSPAYWGSELTDNARNRLARDSTPQHPDYAYESVTGNQYLLPGQGEWIDQYNTAIQGGYLPPEHVVINAEMEMSKQYESSNRGNWMDESMSPDFARVMHDQEVFDATLAARQADGDMIYQNYLSELERQFPGVARAREGAIPWGPAMPLPPGGVEVMSQLEAGRHAFLADPNADMGRYRRWMDQKMTEYGVDPSNVAWDAMESGFQQHERTKSQQINAAGRDFEYRSALTPEAKAQLQAKWQQEDAAPQELASQPPQQVPTAPAAPAQPPQPPQTAPGAADMAQNPYTGTKPPPGLQMAVAAPGAIGGMLQNMGPAGIGGYGLLFDPGATMSLVRGPGGGQKQKMPQLPQLQQPTPPPSPQPAQPLKPPSMPTPPKPLQPQNPMGSKPKIKPMKPPVSAVPG